MINMKKVKWNQVFLLVVIFLFCLILIVSCLQIFQWYKDHQNTHEQIKTIEEVVEIIETEDTLNAEIVSQKEEIPESNPYWDFIKMNMIQVDFHELKKINEQTKGWIQVNGTNINYPFVQASDNVYYLNHTFDKSWNKAGWVFLDYRNTEEINSKNNILYAHGRFDNTMFGSLKKILKNDWLKDSNNYVVKLSTETSNTLWQVFSVYRIPNTNDYIQVYFASDEEFLQFANMLKERSQYNFSTSIYPEDIILTLSTCYDDHDKVVLHAKLIKKENR